ncbi:uncharacterized protein LOC128229744 [Mya arenaria]|uniref:uncharacterized protein LOC128229744 n=1 Tax=Mya arenaria TaxID=6604 RepID=UPI0022E33CB7|nr:uncharacterized protein LOC128229744 [Mya arenaria]
MTMRLHLITFLVSAGIVQASAAKSSAAEVYQKPMSKITNDRVLHHIARLKSKPKSSLWAKHYKGTVKRSFDTLDLDQLLNDPFFNDIENEPLESDKDYKEDAFNDDYLDLSAFDDLFNPDQDSSEVEKHEHFSDKMHHNEIPNVIPDEMENVFNELNNLPKDKDPMSNVIPGAEGPFGIPSQPYSGYQHQPYHFPEAQPPQHFADPFSRNNYPGPVPPHHSRYYTEPYLTNIPPRAQTNADKMMDEFMQFLFLKETGMLDQCMSLRRKRK